MIILRLQAERLHRYRKLRLADLPERGIIAVSGDNESGKSAIGEIICFALFGRTYVLAADRIGKLVHWGTGQGAVTLQFRAKGVTYEVSRQLARDGQQSARLVLADEPDEPLARGGVAVTEAIEGILGHGFEAYVETFYLAQREIITPQPQGPAVRAMVGVAPLERCAGELADEALVREGAIERASAAIAELDKALEHLELEPDRLEEMERKLEETAARERATARQLAELEGAGDEYCDACRGMGSHGARRATAGLLATLTLLSLLLLAGLWTMLRFRPDSWPTPQLRQWLEPMASGAGLPLHSAVLYASYVLAGLLVMLWVWLALLRLDTHRRRSRARRLSQALETIEALEPAPGAVRGEGSPDLAEVALPGAEAAVVDKPDDERRARLQRRILALEASEQEVRAAVGHEAAWMRRRVARLGARRAAGLEELDRARADGLRRGDLQRRREELEDELAEHRRQKALRRLACRLLDGSARAVSERFSDHLRGMVSRALPQFTEGRYDYLEVDEAFQVRVYSSDKRNLLDLDEISSGTQRQILLALRLGLSQELVSRLVKDDQFAFLDEPFAFFDSTRLRGALRTLLELGGDVVQYWVVVQRFPQDTHIGIEIPCGRHPDTLVIGRPDTD
jgi:exonuclease SbcC